MSTTPEPRRRFARVRKAADRIPTRWFAGIVTGLFLLGSAAFGGLNDVPAAALAEVEVGTVVEGQQFDIAIDRVVLVDSLPDFNLEPDDEGDRLLAVIMTVENAWDRPMGTGTEIGLGGNYRIVDDEGVVSSDADYLRWDDSTRSPSFQPGLPVQVAAFWDVDADAYAEGDDLTIEFIDRTFRAEGFVIYGGIWEDETPIARVRVPIDDIGAGAPVDDAEEGSAG